MGYNKAKQKKAWDKWKEKEEYIMKEIGVEESIIKDIYQFDLDLFNAERRFLERQFTNSTLLDYTPIEKSMEIDTLEKLLDQLENEQLYILLKNMKKMDLMIILFKLCGYKNNEIASFLKVSRSAVSQRIKKLQKKLRKFL